MCVCVLYVSTLDHWCLPSFQSHYSLATAQQAYKSLVKIHDKNGEQSSRPCSCHSCANLLQTVLYVALRKSLVQ